MNKAKWLAFYCKTRGIRNKLKFYYNSRLGWVVEIDGPGAPQIIASNFTWTVAKLAEGFLDFLKDERK